MGKVLLDAARVDVPFEPVSVSDRNGETRAPDFLAKNPFGKLPILEDDGFRLRESSAICVYLAENHPKKGLLPNPGSRERALVNQWMSFAVADLEQPLWRTMKHRFLYPEKMRIPAEVEVAHADFKALAATLEHELRADYVVGNAFTLADLTLAYTLKWSRIERIHQSSHIAPRLPARTLLVTHPRGCRPGHSARLPMTYQDHIARDPQICAGQPVVRGTRVPVRIILAHLAHGETAEAIIKEFPTLSEEDIRAVIAFAAASATEDLLNPSPVDSRPSNRRDRCLAELRSTYSSSEESFLYASNFPSRSYRSVASESTSTMRVGFTIASPMLCPFLSCTVRVMSGPHTTLASA